MYSSNNEYIFDLIKLCQLCMSEGEPYSESLSRIREKERDVEGFPTLLTLRSVFGLSDCEIFCVMLAFGCELDGGLRNQMREMCGLTVPSFDVAFAIWSREHALLPEEFMLAAHPESPLSRFILENREHTVATLHTPLKLRAGVLCYLTAGQIPDNRYYDFLRFSEALPLHQPEFLRMLRFARAALKGDETGYIYLCGKTGTGRRCLAARVASELGVRLIRVNMNAIPAENDGLYRLSRELAADAVLARAAVCMEDCAPEQEDILRRLLEFFPDKGMLLFVTGGEGSVPPYIPDRPAFVETVGALSRGEFIVAAEHLAMGPLPEHFPDHLRLSVSELAQAMQNARLRAGNRGGGSFTAEDFIWSVRQIEGRISNARAENAQITLEDVILAPATRRKLDLLCRFIRKSETIREQWGFSSIHAYGRGVVGLFCGASGTGKTMAANAVANSLGLSLVRIDLSKILDKYIGETEKRLSQLFEKADSQNCILFFDEADALFSKRTDISSSHDRYANVETSFLLQCIEEFTGVTILATNLFQNFDEAFMRRITVIARFNMPDEDLRYNMWKKFFPQQTPLASDVDFSVLAKELEISPAIIKAAAFTAAILASEEGDTVAMRHILSALENELGKWGKEGMLKELQISL